MKKLGAWSVVVALVVFGAGCVREVAPTVEYYRSHADERRTQLQKCGNDPGSLANSPTCVNALQADQLESRDSLRGLPPMGLDEQKPTPAHEDEEGTR